MTSITDKRLDIGLKSINNDIVSSNLFESRTFAPNSIASIQPTGLIAKGKEEELTIPINKEQQKSCKTRIKDFFQRLKNLGLLYWCMTVSYSCCMNMLYFVNFQIFQLVMIKKLKVPLDQSKSIMAFYP